jgi:hypothetical protein
LFKTFQKHINLNFIIFKAKNFINQKFVFNANFNQHCTKKTRQNFALFFALMRLEKIVDFNLPKFMGFIVATFNEAHI